MRPQPLNSIKHWAQTAWSRANDSLLGITTEPDDAVDPAADPKRSWRYDASVDRSSHRDSVIYRPADYLNLWRVMRLLSPSQKDVFYDIGCGKGRVVCVAARHPFKRVVGIELSETLCDLARANVEGLRGRKAPIEIRCEDAAVADLSGGTVYFMYNPFEQATMRDVLANINRSLVQAQRTATIVYYNAQHGDLIRSSGFPVVLAEFKTLAGHRVRFYCNRKPA